MILTIELSSEQERTLIRNVGLIVANARPDLNVVLSDETIALAGMYCLAMALTTEWTRETLIAVAFTAAIEDSKEKGT